MKCLIVLIAYLLSYPSFAATIAQTYQCSGVVHDATGGGDSGRCCRDASIRK